eukprot:gnl/Chilomastix_caulleri/1333.p1 GENE.gnl/Chilomastix_caulleri/1333~~gnl/Chilomastix_caulleri/1333.p1  ORF type:complete len:95 (+),score=11.11 gnl/Chilomastix_caulleri/1333:103-387(+)
MSKPGFIALIKARKIRTQALNHAKSFKNEGIREYFTQHITDDYELIQNVEDKQEREQLIDQMRDLRDVLKKQSTISNMFYDDAKRIGNFTGFKV